MGDNCNCNRRVRARLSATWLPALFPQLIEQRLSSGLLYQFYLNSSPPFSSIFVSSSTMTSPGLTRLFVLALRLVMIYSKECHLKQRSSLLQTEVMNSRP